MGEDLAIRILLAHLTGDYLLQNKAMALQKTSAGWRGLFWCSFHCLVYTIAVALWLWTLSPLVLIIVFATHWFMDRWSLGKYWLKLIRGRDILTAATAEWDLYRDIHVAFACLVYAIVDNTFHLIVLWLVVYYY